MTVKVITASNRRVGGDLRHFLKAVGLVAVFTSLAFYTVTNDSSRQFGVIFSKLGNPCQTSGCSDLPFNASIHREAGIDFLVFNKGCKLMNMLPFDPDVTKFLKKSKKQKCKDALVKTVSGTQRIKIDEKVSKSWKFAKSKCCYREITRITQKPEKYDNKADSKVKIGEQCIPIPAATELEVPSPTEFLKLECKNELDVESFVGFDAIVHPPTKFTNKTAAKSAFWEENFVQKNKTLPPGVIVVGIDSISRLHMYRSLPKTRASLYSQDFVELLGYTKVGDNTFPNIMAGFAGRDTKLTSACWKDRKDKLDSCEHIWKNFSSANYLTAFLEDAPGIAIFNYLKTGFVLPPADYYLRPLMVADQQYSKRSQSSAQSSCLRGLTPTSFMSEYLKDFSSQVSASYPSFLLSWFTTVGHDDFNLLKLYDEEFQDLLESVVSSSGENSVIFFISDHGYRFGSFRETFLGYYEESLPFFFVRIPPSLRQSHPQWYKNLKTNVNRLTTPFDLYETLKDILNLAETSNNITSPKAPAFPPPVYASSLFSLGRLNRTCEESGIPQRYCLCGLTPHLFKDKKLIKQFGELIVNKVNEIIKERDTSSQCAALEYKSQVYVREVGGGDKWNNLGKIEPYKDYVMALETSPGGGRFESRIRHFENGVLELEGAGVSRINSYAGLSDCVTSDYVLRNYCMCKDVVEKQKKEKLEKEKKEKAKKKEKSKKG